MPRGSGLNAMTNAADDVDLVALGAAEAVEIFARISAVPLHLRLGNPDSRPATRPLQIKLRTQGDDPAELHTAVMELRACDAVLAIYAASRACGLFDVYFASAPRYAAARRALGRRCYVLAAPVEPLAYRPARTIYLAGRPRTPDETVDGVVLYAGDAVPFPNATTQETTADGHLYTYEDIHTAQDDVKHYLHCRERYGPALVATIQITP